MAVCVFGTNFHTENRGKTGERVNKGPENGAWHGAVCDLQNSNQTRAQRQNKLVRRRREAKRTFNRNQQVLEMCGKLCEGAERGWDIKEPRQTLPLPHPLLLLLLLFLCVSCAIKKISKGFQRFQTTPSLPPTFPPVKVTPLGGRERRAGCGCILLLPACVPIFPGVFPTYFFLYLFTSNFWGKLSEPKNKYIPTYLKGKKYN